MEKMDEDVSVDAQYITEIVLLHALLGLMEYMSEICVTKSKYCFDMYSFSIMDALLLEKDFEDHTPEIFLINATMFND